MATCEEESSASFESRNAIIMDANNDVEVIKVMVNGDVSVHGDGDGDECRRTYVVAEEDGVVEQIEKLELQSNCSNGSKIEEEKREESIECNDDNDVADIKVMVNDDVSGHGDGDECRTYVVVEEDGAVEQQLERLELQSNCSNGSKIEEEKREEHVECNDDNNVAENKAKSRVYSLRPYVVDCTYYTKTGTCKFGKNCRFNHPLWRAFKPGGDKEKTCEESIESVDDAAKIECKYYQTAGWCKYGDACRYNHSVRKIEKEYLQLNFLGLPIRPTAQECAYYLQHGSCAYGASCRFNHPEPSAVNEHNKSGDSLGNDNFEESGVNSSRNCRGVSLQSFGGLQQHASMSHNDIDLRNGSNDMMSSYHQRLPQTPETDASQVISPSANKFVLPHQMVSSISERVAPVSHDENPIEFDEFPVRPGQPDCNFFMKTGYCKFRSACKYNHPSSQMSKQSKPPPILPSQLLNGTYSTRHKNQQMHRALSEQGLPLRPGAKLCRNYEQQGMCRYGRNCLFNHPDV